ncbi:complement decay-accelerating factor isoform X3 [Saimiri boliviensis]|uniref:complement decay-accelerating factor isoform X3 n=1 Tax=Saimiri boliviensis TaxID=27679 RepID=UPI00193D9B4E|nr:complement decay-accelerating factor isoform X1 [Saimiri boliviensis boliviensis]
MASPALTPRAMTVAQPSVPAALRLFGGLPGLLLLLLLCLPAVRGDCGLPPDVPNAQPALGNRTSFPEDAVVTYQCNESYVKIPGSKDSVICRQDGQWTDIEEFCNRSCNAPPRLSFAALAPPHISQNYFPVGTVIQYDCRPGYRRDPSLSRKVTCLQNLQWSTAPEFCKKRSCRNPGELLNGNINIPDGTLFGASITFSCNPGYKLYGETSSICLVSGNSVQWSDPLPECREIYCSAPPTINNGIIEGEREHYGYRQSVTYLCNKGFTMIGHNSIYCTVNGDEGEWSGPPPVCTGKSVTSMAPPTVQKSTTVNIPTTEASSTSQETSTSQKISTSQKTTTANAQATQSTPVSRTTKHSHETTPSKGSGAGSGTTVLLSGLKAQGPGAAGVQIQVLEFKGLRGRSSDV